MAVLSYNYLTPGIIAVAVFLVWRQVLQPSIMHILRNMKINKALDVFPSMQRHWLYGSEAGNGSLDSGYLQLHLRYAQQAPRAYRKWEGPFHSALVLCHPETIKPVLLEPNCKSWTYNVLKQILGDGLVTSSGAKWQRNRRLITPSFHFNMLKSYIDIVNDACDVFLAKLDTLTDSWEHILIKEHLGLLSMDIILQSAFSLQTDCQISGCRNAHVAANCEFVKLWSKTLGNILYVVLPFVYRFTADGKRFKEVRDRLQKEGNDIILSRKKAMEDEGYAAPSEKRTLDFLDILLMAKDEDGRGMDQEDIRAEVDTFIGAGHHSTSSSLWWIFYQLAKHPQYQREIQEEIDALVDELGTDRIDWNSLTKLPVLTRFVMETMRLFPPVPLTSRCLTQDTMIEGHIVPEGTTVDIPIWALHRNALVWGGDYMDFRPERFLEENVAQRDRFAFIPFGAGPRNCIGKNFAMNEVKIVIARVLHKYSFSLQENCPAPKPMVFVALVPEEEIPFKIMSRSKDFNNIPD